MAVLPEVHALPCAEQKISVTEGNAELGGGERGLDMGGHVVGPFQGVGVERIIFRHQSI